jgi:phosphatidylserine synthase
MSYMCVAIVILIKKPTTDTFRVASSMRVTITKILLQKTAKFKRLSRMSTQGKLSFSLLTHMLAVLFFGDISDRVYFLDP